MKLFVNRKLYSERLDICKGCPHFTSKRTCGTPVIGQTIQHYRNKIKLCGCFMDVKAQLAIARCPMDKWTEADKAHGSNGLTHEQRIDLWNLTEKLVGNKALDTTESRKWWSYMDAIAGRKVNRTNCTSCINEMIQSYRPELREYIKQNTFEESVEGEEVKPSKKRKSKSK